MTLQEVVTNPPARLRRRVIVIAAISLAIILIGAAALTMALLLTRDSRVDLQPEYFIGVDGQTSIELLEGAVDVTAGTCGASFDCESAWGTNEMVLMKFATKNAAAIAARSIGASAYQSDWLVANFVGDSVSDVDRRSAAEVLDGAWQSEVN